MTKIIPAFKTIDDPPEQQINCQPLLILLSLVLVDLFGSMKISKDLIEIFENISIESITKKLENLCHPNSIESKSKMSTFINFETAIKPRLCNFFYLTFLKFLDPFFTYAFHIEMKLF